MRCYVEPEQWSSDRISLSDEESHHAAHVLRGEVGQPITVFDGRGREATATIDEVVRGRVTVRVLQQTTKARPPVAITLIQAVPREQKMDFVLQKATELGVATIFPVVTDHAVVRLKHGEDEGKIHRWEKIILNAAKQCGAAWLPEVKPVESLVDLLPRLPKQDVIITCSLEPDALPLREVIETCRPARPLSIACLIGPEGDFSMRELTAARKAGGRPASLGDAVLRVETASIYVLSVLRYEFLDR